MTVTVLVVLDEEDEERVVEIVVGTTGFMVSIARSASATVVVTVVAVEEDVGTVDNVRTPVGSIDPSNLARELPSEATVVFTVRLVSDPELAALIPRPIFARRLLSEPVFLSRSGGAGGTVVSPAAFLCNC